MALVHQQQSRGGESVWGQVWGGRGAAEQVWKLFWAPGSATNELSLSSLNKFWETWVIISRQIGEFEVVVIIFCHYFKLLFLVFSASRSSVLLSLVSSIWALECPPSPFSQNNLVLTRNSCLGIFCHPPTTFPRWLLNSDCIHRGECELESPLCTTTQQSGYGAPIFESCWCQGNSRSGFPTETLWSRQKQTKFLVWTAFFFSFFPLETWYGKFEKNCLYTMLEYILE